MYRVKWLNHPSSAVVQGLRPVTFVEVQQRKHGVVRLSDGSAFENVTTGGSTRSSGISPSGNARGGGSTSG